MMILGLILHSACSYVGAELGNAWPFKDATATDSNLLDLLVVFIHSFRMPIFFLLAGFFGALPYSSRGRSVFLLNRGQRVLFPFAIGLPLFIPPTNLGFDLANLNLGFEGIHILEFTNFAVSDTGHLWFLYYLIYFYIGVILIEKAIEKIPSEALAKVESFFLYVLASRLKLPFLAGVSALTLLPMEYGTYRTSNFFTPDFEVLLAYSIFFAFGYFLYSNQHLLTSIRRFPKTNFLIGLTLFPLNSFVILSIIKSESLFSGDRYFALVSTALMVWCFVFSFIAFSMRYFEKPKSWIRYLTDASYWMYLVHLPFTIWIPALLTPVALSPYIKFSITLVLTTSICLVSYEFLVRNTIIGQFLNGRRYPNTVNPLRLLFGLFYSRKRVSNQTLKRKSI